MCNVPGMQGHPSTDSTPVRLGVIGSGQGTNFEAVARAIDAGELNATPVIVISDVETAGILTKARGRGIPAHFVDPGPYATKLSDEAQERMAALFAEAGVEVIICAGFMRKLKEPVLGPYGGRILNVHPSLLPQFPGRDAIAQALAAGVKETGCTVHLVTEEIDSGAVLSQERVAIGEGETHAGLLAKVNAAEHRLYTRTIADFIRTLPRGEA